MDAHYHESRSNMFKEMQADYIERISKMYGAPGE